MKERDLIIKSIEELNQKISNMDKLLEILLVNSMVDDINSTCNHKMESIKEELQKYLRPYNLVVLKNLQENGFNFFYIQVPRKSKLSSKEFLFIYHEIKTMFSIEPVFQFEWINGMQRKRLIQEDISFCVVDKEIYICSKKMLNSK